MDRLDYYIEKQYGNDPKWFEEEIIQGIKTGQIDKSNNKFGLICDMTLYCAKVI